MNRFPAIVVGAALVTLGPGALGNDLVLEEGFTASFVMRLVDTPTGPMIVCGNPLPEDAEWLDAMPAGSGVTDFGTAFVPDNSVGGRSGPGAPHAGHAPAPGAGGVLLVSSVIMARRRRR